MIKKFLIFLLFATCLNASRQAIPQEVSEPLNRLVDLKKVNASSTDAITTILAQSQLAGGIISVSDSCEPLDKRTFEIHQATVRQGLDYMLAKDGSLQWKFKDGLVLVGTQFVHSTLLNTRITQIKLNTSDSLSLLTQRLLESSEVQNRMRREHMDEQPPVLGFSTLSVATASKEQLPYPTSQLLRGITLFEALNIIASSKKNAVWHYQQFACGNKSSFRIYWPIN